MDTIRRQLIALLRANEMGAREISRALGIREKAVYEHLPHVAKTLAGEGRNSPWRPRSACPAATSSPTDRG